MVTGDPLHCAEHKCNGQSTDGDEPEFDLSGDKRVAVSEQTIPEGLQECDDSSSAAQALLISQ